MMKRSKRFAVALTALVLMSTAIAVPADAVTGYGNSAYVYGVPNNIGCFWEYSGYRDPGASSEIDFNVYAFREPYTSCDGAAPWLNFGDSQLQVEASLWTGSLNILCATTTAWTVPNGAASGWGVGQGYNRSGNCANASHFWVISTGYAPGGGTAQSIVDFNF